MIKDLIGERFDRLIVIEFAGKDQNRNNKWKCKCDCGNIKIIRESSLINKDTKSCGCFRKEMVRKRSTKHGYAQRGRISKTHTVWWSMIQRCTNKNHKSYKDYGGRENPITVCCRWSNINPDGFNNFITDMDERPNNKYQLDRINNSLGYFKANCRWTTCKINSRNRRDNHLLKYDEKELCISEWSEITGIGKATIRERIERGWSVKRALTTLVKKHRKKND